MHYVSSPAMNYSLKHRPKGHYFEYLVIVMTLCRKSFVLRFLYDIRSFCSAVFFSIMYRLLPATSRSGREH